MENFKKGVALHRASASIYGLSFTNLHNGNGIEISKNIYYQNGISIRQIVNSLYILLLYEYNQILYFLKNGMNRSSEETITSKY